MAFETTKNYYSIGEVSRIAGVPAYLLRYWETFFTELRPARDTRGNRRYTNRDMAMVLKIKELVHEQGYRLKKAGNILKGEGPSREEDHKTVQLLKLQKEMERSQKESRLVGGRRETVLREIKLEIEAILQMLG